MGLIRLLCKALKCTSHFRWLISPKSVFLVVSEKSSWCLCQRGAFCFGGVSSQAADLGRYQVTRPNQHLFAASSLRKEKRVYSELRWKLKSGRISLLHMDGPFFRHALLLLPIRGFLEFLHFLNLFYLLSFFLFSTC